MSRTSASSAASNPRTPRPRVKVWLEIDGEYVFGHGLCEILRAVDETGSIKEGAVRLEKSYRYVWGRIKEAEKALGESLVITHVGGSGVQRSELTVRARQLCRAFCRMRERMIAAVGKEFDRLMKSVAEDR